MSAKVRNPCWITAQVEQSFKQEIEDEINRSYPKWKSLSDFVRVAVEDRLRQEQSTAVTGK